MKKAKAAGVSASSFFDLKAELSKRENEFSKSKAAGKNPIVKGSDKKSTVWARQNKGVGSRAARDTDLEAVSKPTLDAARAALERKAKIYDKLRKGQSGGLNEKQYDMLLVDFDGKPDDPYESDSDDVDESLEVPTAPDNQDDPVVEYEDEFGRIRTARLSEVPRHVAHAPQSSNHAQEEDIVIRNPVNHFPTYQPSEERAAEIEVAFSEDNNPLGIHYDATREVRAKAAGYYQFSVDEETRKQQMDELKSAREETLKTRHETGALDVMPGQVEAMQDEAIGLKSRAMEKRKRQLEERRRQVEAKRRKLPAASESAAGSSQVGNTDITEPPIAVPSTPATPTQTNKGMVASSIQTEASAFLAQLEQDILTETRKCSKV